MKGKDLGGVHTGSLNIKRWVVLEVLSNTGEIDDYVDSKPLQKWLGTDSSQLQELRRVASSSGQNNFLFGGNSGDRASFAIGELWQRKKMSIPKLEYEE